METRTPTAATSAYDRTAGRVWGVLRAAAVLLIVVTMTTQIVDAATHNAYQPVQYFSYLSVDTSMIEAATLILAADVAWKAGSETPSFTAVRMAVLTHAIVMAFGYLIIMRAMPSTGYSTIPWPQWAMHVWVPAYILLDWLFAPGRRSLEWRSIWVVTVFPTVWLVYTFVRGFLTGEYPYAFLSPAEGGWGSVLLHLAGLTGLAFAVGAGAIWLSRRSHRGK